MDLLANWMKKVEKQVKMADLNFVDFSLIPSLLSKEKHFKVDVTLY